MGERDWLTELSSALGDEAPGAVAPVGAAGEGAAERGLTVVPSPDHPPPTPPVAVPSLDDELDLMGPGRSLEGWAEELASAFAEDDEPDLEPELEPEAVGAHVAALDNILLFDSLAAAPGPAAPVLDDAAVTAAVDVAMAVAASDIAAGFAADAEARDERIKAAEARLERIESLLTADLSQLGPAVLADSIGDLEERLLELRTAVGVVTERLEALPVPDADALAALGAPPAVDGEALAVSLGELRGLVDRLTDRVTAQARFLVAHADTTSAEAHQRDDVLQAILAHLEARG